MLRVQRRIWCSWGKSCVSECDDVKRGWRIVVIIDTIGTQVSVYIIAEIT
jgi:hypothetical protein